MHGQAYYDELGGEFNDQSLRTQQRDGTLHFADLAYQIAISPHLLSIADGFDAVEDMLVKHRGLGYLEFAKSEAERCGRRMRQLCRQPDARRPPPPGARRLRCLAAGLHQSWPFRDRVRRQTDLPAVGPRRHYQCRGLARSERARAPGASRAAADDAPVCRRRFWHSAHARRSARHLRRRQAPLLRARRSQVLVAPQLPRVARMRTPGSGQGRPDHHGMLPLAVRCQRAHVRAHEPGRLSAAPPGRHRGAHHLSACLRPCQPHHARQ